MAVEEVKGIRPGVCRYTAEEASCRLAQWYRSMTGDEAKSRPTSTCGGLGCHLNLHGFMNSTLAGT